MPALEPVMRAHAGSGPARFQEANDEVGGEKEGTSPNAREHVNPEAGNSGHFEWNLSCVNLSIKPIICLGLCRRSS